MQEVILFYNGLEVPTRKILDSKGVIPSKTVADAKVAIQEMAEYSQKRHNGTSRTRSTKTFDGLAAIQAQLNNLGREIKKVNEKVYAAQVGCEQCKGPHYTKDLPLTKKKGKPLKKLTTLNLVHLSKEGDIEQQLRDSTKGIMQILRIGRFVFPVDFIILDLAEDIQSCNDPRKTIFLRRDQVDDLMLIIKEGEVFEEVKAMNDARMVSKFFRYHSDYDQSEKIRIDCAHNLKFSCMIVVEDMDLYIDEGMGEVVVGKPFCEVSCVETKSNYGVLGRYDVSVPALHKRPQRNKIQYAVVRYKEFGELIQPFKDPKRVSQLDRKLFKTAETMMELTLEESLSMFMAEIAKRHDEHSNLIKEIQAFTNFALRNQKASIKALEIQVRQMNIILHKKLYGNLQSSTKIKPRGNDETISTSVKADKPSIRRIDAS
ncbi:hypothetical protein Tco_0800614 [Tanacetum coccineum]|uniref:Uncharacterized protein n=1 Tax=Tanacetum coccineum TaxID=301880 RepID=A0ABQ4ZWC9_9ASTR